MHHRINYVIPDELDDQLAAYCARTGRSGTDVVRQLVVEWLEGDRRLPSPARSHPIGRRTNVGLSDAARAALEAKIESEGHGTFAAVIAALLAPFLAHRASQEEAMPVRVRLSAEVYDKLFIFCERWNWTVADGLRLLAESPGAFERLSEIALARAQDRGM